MESRGFITEFESDEIEELEDATAKRRPQRDPAPHELFGLCEEARGYRADSVPGEGAGRKGR